MQIQFPGEGCSEGSVSGTAFCVIKSYRIINNQHPAMQFSIKIFFFYRYCFFHVQEKTWLLFCMKKISWFKGKTSVAPKVKWSVPYKYCLLQRLALENFIWKLHKYWLYLASQNIYIDSHKCAILSCHKTAGN